MRFFKLWDSKQVSGPQGMLEIPKTELKYWNDQKFGIFWCINSFHGEARKKENLTKINVYYADIDNFRKAKQWETIEKGLKPSYVVETKKGFQVYWKVKDGNIQNWSMIMERIREYYSADPNAKDVLRVLRVPNYYHWKDHNNPFLVREVYKSGITYSEKDLISFYPESEKEKFTKTPEAKEISYFGNDLFERVYNLDCESALLRLSGTGYVYGESYSFRRTGSGNKNIYVNGKSTSCWVDKDGHIGSFDKGGPTIWQWLRWFGHNNKEVCEILKKEFSELWNGL